MQRMLLAFVLLTLLIVSVTCTTKNKLATTPPIIQNGISLRVINHSWSYTRVYLNLNGRTSRRLGEVEANTTEMFAFRDSPGSTYSFALKPIAAPQLYTTEAINATAGDRLELVISNYLPATTLIRLP